MAPRLSFFNVLDHHVASCGNVRRLPCLSRRRGNLNAYLASWPAFLDTSNGSFGPRRSVGGMLMRWPSCRFAEQRPTSGRMAPGSISQKNEPFSFLLARLGNPRRNGLYPFGFYIRQVYVARIGSNSGLQSSLSGRDPKWPGSWGFAESDGHWVCPPSNHRSLNSLSSSDPTAL